MTPIDCIEEWHPGSARSTVSIEQAAPRIAGSSAAALIAAFNAHRPDDVVEVRRDGIRSTAGRRYGSDIHDMNAGDAGKVCHKVTRFTWNDEHVEGGMVYVVDGRAFVYFAVCGNLAELDLFEPPHADSSTRGAAPAAPEGPSSGGGMGGGSEAGTESGGGPVATGLALGGPQSQTTGPGEGTSDVPVFGVPGWPGVSGGSPGGPWGVGIGGGLPDCPPCPCGPVAPPPIAPAVPEPPTWALMLSAIGLVAVFRRWRVGALGGSGAVVS